jgi:hypothetical protein
VSATALTGLALNYLSSESFAGHTNPTGLARGFLLIINGLGVAALLITYLAASRRPAISPE